MILVALSWLLPLGIGLFQRARLALNAAWWRDVGEIAATIYYLRDYWFVTIPILALSLLVAASVLLLRSREAALLATAVFIVALTINGAELLLLVIAQRDFATKIGTAMDIPPSEVGGLHAGIAASFGDFLYKGVWLLYLLFARQVRTTFGPVTWARFRDWAA